CSRIPSAPASAGVTDGQRTSSRARATGSAAMAQGSSRRPRERQRAGSDLTLERVRAVLVGSDGATQAAEPNQPPQKESNPPQAQNGHTADDLCQLSLA